MRSDFKIDAYWQTLKTNGLTKERLASYDRPIVSEPRFRSDAKEGLIRDLTMYLKTLKVYIITITSLFSATTCNLVSVPHSILNF